MAVGQVILVNCTDALLTNLTISHSGAGVLILGGSDLGIKDSVFEHNQLAISAADMRNFTVYHNNFLNNGHSPSDPAWVSPGRSVSLDAGYPRGGNFWSNFTGADVCSGARQDNCTGPDGFFDAPFSLGYPYPGEVRHQDNFPLVSPYEPGSTPPAAVLSAFPRKGNLTTAFRFNADLSSDQEDLPRLLRFAFDIDGDGRADADWSNTPALSHTFATAGNHTVTAFVRDTGGLEASASTWVIVVDAPADVTAPRILATAPAKVSAGQVFEVTFEVEDEGNLTGVRFFFQQSDDWRETALDLEPRADGSYAVTIQAPGSGWVRFRATALDEWGNEARAPETGAFEVRVERADGVSAWIGPALWVLVAAVGAGAVLVYGRSKPRP